MRKLMNVFIAVFVVSFGLLYWINSLNKSEGYSGGNTVSVYNWGDYIDPDLIDQFEEETGYKVVYQTFDSNEAMIAKLEQGGTNIDVTVPSEYAIQKMKDDQLLMELDHSRIPNLQYIDKRFLDLDFDKGNKYSIPYFWGTVGILYNPSMLNGQTFNSWNDLWDPELENQILLVDGAREVMGMGLNSLGYSLNSTDDKELQQAKEKLDGLVPNVKAIVGDEIKTLMANEEGAVALVWSGDAADTMWENENLDYVVPEEGSNLWFDNMVIPKGAQNVDGAYAFINFMLDPENAAQNTDYVGYSTPNSASLELLDEEVTSDERFYPSPELTSKLEVYKNLGKQMQAKYSELFLEFKMHSK
ncbi:MAG: PotD/PotF family extracellular solute-binding protein [Bacillus sp. (in: firmicutes)]